jgi:hypothetical protein
MGCFVWGAGSSCAGRAGNGYKSPKSCTHLRFPSTYANEYRVLDTHTTDTAAPATTAMDRELTSLQATKAPPDRSGGAFQFLYD